MKIISWNLNGLKSAIDSGLVSFIDESEADIYVFQETKVGIKLNIETKEKYLSYWYSDKENTGYSGTLCLTRFPPNRVFYGIEGIDNLNFEGRIITLEFDTFYVVNCYFPNSQSSNQRKDYRYKWDKIIFDYLMNLKKKKQVIVCGDFNVSYLYEDTFEGSRYLNKDDKDFETIERENFKKLLKAGFIDAFREKHEDAKNKYTWWSNKDNKRKENKGYRLDYFLVNEKLKDKIIESNILSEVFGSDHCPIVLEIDIDSGAKKKLCPCSYEDIKELDKAGVSLEELKEYDLSEVWGSIDLDKAGETLEEDQKKLTIYAAKRDYINMRKMQDKIVSSMDAKMLAVEHVANNIKTPGCDGVLWDTDDKKMQAVLSLTPILYNAKPNILFSLNCRNGKTRHIQIPTCHDRAMQCLYAYALDPISEAWGEKKSFSYRKGKSSYDLDAYIKKALSGKDAPNFLFIGDISKCYEHFDHEFILDNIPLDKEVLTQFIKSGYIFEGELFSDKIEGIGIGCTISPIIANMCLDGLSKYIYEKLYKNKNLKIDYEGADMIRYADDILFTARSRESAKEIETHVIQFLKKRGLNLSAHKTKIININEENFIFAGREYYKENGRVFSKIPKERIERFKNSIKDLVSNHKGSQQSLIEEINKKIDGFASYHKVSEATKVFIELDDYIRALLFEMCYTRYKTYSKKTILKKYWFHDGKGRDCYSLLNKKEVRVKCLEDTILITHKPVLLNKNPYIDLEYFESKNHDREIFNVVGKYRKIWNRQGGKCHYCGRPILINEEKTLVEYNPNGKSEVLRNAYVHKRCLGSTIEYIDVDEEPSSINDLNEIFERFNESKKSGGSKYQKLFDYFKKHDPVPFNLSFKKIEEIIERKLDEDSKEEKYWFNKSKGSIAHCWLDNGFEINYVSFSKNPKISFKVSNDSKHMVHVNVPKKILNAKLTVEASYELKNFLEYFADKYGL